MKRIVLPAMAACALLGVAAQAQTPVAAAGADALPSVVAFFDLMAEGYNGGRVCRSFDMPTAVVKTSKGLEIVAQYNFARADWPTGPVAEDGSFDTRSSSSLGSRFTGKFKNGTIEGGQLWSDRCEYRITKMLDPT